MAKKILIITNEMIPYSLTWGGCQRMYYLASELTKSGHEVDVIALRSSAYNTFGKDLLPRVDFVEGARKQEVHSGAPQKTAAKHVLINLIKYIDRLIFNEITPGNGIQTYFRSKKAEPILKERLQSKDYDIAIVSAPPFSIYRLINVLKKNSKAKIIMDYRDPWNLWKEGNPVCSRRERQFQSASDMIVCTNSTLCKDMSERYNIDISKFHVIANGFSASNPSNEDNSIVMPEGLNIVYTGSVVFTNSKDDYRNPMNLLAAFKQFISEGKRNVNLWFIGAGLTNKEYINQLINEYNGHLHIMGFVSETKAKTYLQKSDICLLLHTAEDNSGRYLISGKAYDYIQMKKYILSVSRNDSQHATILKENNIGINVTNNQANILEALNECYQKWLDGKLESVYSKVDIESFSRQSQIRKYIELIESI